jgi:3-hydroxyisobutyrate dehydrogenase
MARLGFLGTGLMGAPMVRRLEDGGARLVIWNRDARKAAALRSPHVSIADTPQDVGAACDIAALCLTDAAAVETVLFGPNGVVAAGRSVLIVDFTSMAPAQAAAIGNRLAAHGCRYIDAPVSGGVAGAEAGTLVVMCGGEPADVEAAGPIFDAVAARVTHLGPVGAGQVAKLMNQHIVASSVLAMAEAFAFGRRAGIDVARVPEALAGGFADSRAFQLWGTRMAMGAWQPNVGALDTMLKDVRNAVSSMTDLGLASPLGHAVREIYEALSASGKGADDLGSISTYFEELR